MSYRRIENLVADGEQVDLTYMPQNREEIEKCRQDVEYFLRNYFYINTREFGYHLFQLRPRQVEELAALQEHRFIKGDWYRQAGFTTLVLAFMLWRCIFYPGTTCLYMDPKNKGAQGYFRSIVRMGYIMLPAWMQVGVKEWSNRRIVFSNGSEFHARPEHADNVGGVGWDYLFLDDFGWITDNALTGFVQVVFPGYKSSAKRHLILGEAYRFGRCSLAQLMFWNNCDIPFHDSTHLWKDDPRLTEEWAKGQRIKIGEACFRKYYEGTIYTSVWDEGTNRTGNAAKWVPVSVRCPETSTPVLVTIRRDTEDPETKRETSIAAFHRYDDGSSCWTDEAGEYEIKGIVAWAPRPEPYRGR